MRLLLIVLVAGLTAGCGSLDKTPGETRDDLRSWIEAGQVIVDIVDERRKERRRRRQAEAGNDRH